MSVSTTDNKKTFNGSGTTGPFTFDFRFFYNSEIHVVKTSSSGVDTELTENVQYTLSGSGSYSGGSVTLSSALASGEKLTIYRKVDLVQPVDLRNQGAFFAEIHEDVFDRMTMVGQQLQEQIDRCAKLPITNVTDAENLVQDIILLADNIDNLNTIVDNTEPINTVADHVTNVNTVSGHISNVDMVAGHISNVDTAASHMSAIDTVASDLNEPVSEIETVSGSITNVNIVGNDIANVNTVAGNTTNINTVAGNTANVTTVAGISGNVTTVAGISANVTAVANNATNINAVNANKANIDAVAGNNTNITAVAGNATNINAVNANKTNIDTVAGKATEVTTVAGIAGNVTTVAGISANVTAVASNSSNINAVAGNATNINAVNANKANIDTVAGISSNVTTVAGISGDVTTVADNVADVTNFADVYYGPSATDPTTRRDGSALKAGDLYFNTAVDELRTYSGTQWVAGTAGTMAVQRFSGNASTLAFTLSTAPAGENNTQVYINGVYQQKDTYGVSGTTLTFSSAPPIGTDNIEVVTISTLALGETDASLVTFTQAGAGVVERTVENKLRDAVSVFDFMTGAQIADVKARSVTIDVSDAIQAAIDTGKRVYLPEGTYRTEKPLYLDGGDVLIGAGSSQTIIIKYTTTVGTGSNVSRSGSITDSYAKDAVVIIRHADNTYSYRTQIKGVWIAGNGWTVAYGIYGPRLSHCIFDDVEIFQCQYGFVTNDAWMCDFTRVTSNPNTLHGVGGYSYGFAGLTYAFYWQNDGSGSATGTTCSFNDCWGRDADYAWYFFGLKYSAMNNCGADNISRTSYYFNLCEMTINGCGTENVLALTSTMFMTYSNLVFNGFHSFQIYGASAGATAMNYCDGGNYTFNSCNFENWTTPGTALNWIIQSGAKVVANNSVFPTNGNTFIGFGGGAKMMKHDGNGLQLLDSELGQDHPRYVRGRINDNKTLQKLSKAVASAGTTICTITDTSAGGGGIYYSTFKLSLAWVDTVWPTGIGQAEMFVQTYRDGANYRQALTVTVNTGTGNGYTTAPSFAISRSGDVWSVTMTPAHGDCTALYLTAEVQNATYMTVALP